MFFSWDYNGICIVCMNKCMRQSRYFNCSPSHRRTHQTSATTAISSPPPPAASKSSAGTKVEQKSRDVSPSTHSKLDLLAPPGVGDSSSNLVAAGKSTSTSSLNLSQLLWTRMDIYYVQQLCDCLFVYLFVCLSLFNLTSLPEACWYNVTIYVKQYYIQTFQCYCIVEIFLTIVVYWFS